MKNNMDVTLCLQIELCFYWTYHLANFKGTEVLISRCVDSSRPFFKYRRRIPPEIATTEVIGKNGGKELGQQ
ncbi:hypothetical protein ZOSMA_193G00240 [Zostera marina]|uniref:Uncharacterized protein n=1 Tax=Zostera marina TaxID=29655 RepID=A0A0K9PNZ6_ZOSMR|nr:hypothetical protein ZOSMA_193G00240 [Zostera marina]